MTIERDSLHSSSRRSDAHQPNPVSTRPAAPFEYVADATGPTPQAAHVVRVGRGVKSKRALLAIYAQSLRLPDYFGWNWDALEEALRDLSWLEPRPNAEGTDPSLTGVAIVHDAIPLRNGSADRRTYLEILSQLAARPAAGGPTVRVVFPDSARAKIEACLAQPSFARA